MATTTTNFGWDIPQSTDLVKDGATAIATLGQDIDTSLVDLKGGTTGQILSKTSGTDMDFTWITPNPGDITGVTAGTGITGGGTSGDVTVSFDIANYGGGQYAAGKNKIINGDFDINQRAFSSTTTSGTYGFDRFYLQTTDGTSTYSAQTFTAGAAPVAGYEATNFARLVSTGQTLATAQSTLRQKIEDVRTFAGQSVTLSFWAKASTGTPAIAAELVQDFGSGGSTSVTGIISTKQTISSSWVRYSFTASVPSISGKTIGTGSNLQVLLWTSAGTDFNARTGSLGIQSVTIDFWGVQLETGSTASPFQTATGTKQGELAACQRYYQRITSEVSYGIIGTGKASNTGNFQVFCPFQTTMRIAPTAIDTSAMSTFQYETGGTSGNTPTAIVINTGVTNSKQGMADVQKTSTFTTGSYYILTGSNNTAAYIGWSAEL